jgi:hypothetical protein
MLDNSFSLFFLLMKLSGITGFGAQLFTQNIVPSIIFQAKSPGYDRGFLLSITRCE